MFVHNQINNNSGINIIYKQSSTICIAKLLYTIMMLTVITLLAGCNSPAKGVYNDSDYNEAVSSLFMEQEIIKGAGLFSSQN